MKSEIDDNEWLYRGVEANPICWDEEEDRPSSAVFKKKSKDENKGLSVDRQGCRREKECVDAMVKRLELKAIVKIKAGDCRAIDLYLKYTPDDNKYHSEIHMSASRVRLTPAKIKKLKILAIRNVINIS